MLKRFQRTTIFVPKSIIHSQTLFFLFSLFIKSEAKTSFKISNIPLGLSDRDNGGVPL